MKKSVPFTHKGWFGLCPVYMADVDSESIRLEPRIPFTSFLIHLSSGIYNVLKSESFPVMFTGEINPPKMIEVEA